MGKLMVKYGKFVLTSEFSIIWNTRFGGKFEAIRVQSFDATNNSTKAKYENIIYTSVHKNCRFPRMQNIFIHVITQINKLTLPVNCCVRLLTCCQNVLDLCGWNNASSNSRYLFESL